MTTPKLSQKGLNDQFTPNQSKKPHIDYSNSSVARSSNNLPVKESYQEDEFTPSMYLRRPSLTESELQSYTYDESQIDLNQYEIYHAGDS